MKQVALITGAGRGIGKGIALELAFLGFDLVLNYRSNREAAETAAAECIAAGATRGHSVRAEICAGDVSSATDREALIEFTRAAFGAIDLLVNNAGIAPKMRADLLDLTEESFDELLAINLKGPFFLTQLVAKWMIQRKRDLGPEYRPNIVTISSISAYTASTNRGDYCISKAGLSMLTPLFAARLASEGIHTYEIRPGIIATDMTAGVKEKYDSLIDGGLTPIRRWGSPSDVGKAVAAIAQGLLPFSTGEIINVDGGFHLRTL